MMEKLKVINLAKSYDRDVPVLRDISFCVDDRDFFVILGPSGCGKTTLLNIIAGVEDINGGEIYIDGIRVNENKPQKRDVAMVFQNYALYPTMNVFDNIAFPLRNRHFKKKEIEGKVLILLYLPCITSPIAYSLFFKQLAYSDGLLTQLFYIFGIGAGDESILANPIIAKLFISFICIWAWTGFYVLIINSALQNMDISIIKAAKIDGASSFRILIKIILPSLASVLLLVVILTSCSAFQIYIEISLITKGGPAMSTFTLVFYLYRKTFTYVAD